jgi:hypothetical protein
MGAETSSLAMCCNPKCVAAVRYQPEKPRQHTGVIPAKAVSIANLGGLHRRLCRAWSGIDGCRLSPA